MANAKNKNQQNSNAIITKGGKIVSTNLDPTIANKIEKSVSKKLDFSFESIKNSGGKGGALLYKSNIYSDNNCTTDKEKKRLRIKLRSTRDKFFGAFLQNQNNSDQIKAIKKDWVKFATDVYIDVNNIIDANGKDDNVAIAKKFVEAMNAK